MRGFGQHEVQMVPLHMAMVAQTVAHGGTMMQPYVVAGTTDSQNRPLSTTEPQVWMTPTSPQTAATLNDLMQQVAVNGTASCCIALDNGIPVAAKTGTGTAQRGTASPSDRTRGSSPSPRPTTPATPSPWCSSDSTPRSAQ